MNPVHPKVAAGALAWWAAVIVVWCVSNFGHVSIPDYVAIAGAGILSTVIAWVVPGATTDGLPAEVAAPPKP